MFRKRDIDAVNHYNLDMSMLATENQVEQRWIPCSKGSGLFSNEVSVTVTDGSGNEVSLFVDSKLIKEHAGKTYLRVSLIGDNGKPQHKSVLLPLETFETGTRWLSVREDLILDLT